jgi:hypothetical protein
MILCLFPAAPVPHWCRKIGQKPSILANDYLSDNMANFLISQHESKFIKVGKNIVHVAHNLKVVGSNPTPATSFPFIYQMPLRKPTTTG